MCTQNLIWGPLNVCVQGTGERQKINIDPVLNPRAILVICWLMGWRAGGLEGWWVEGLVV